MSSIKQWLGQTKKGSLFIWSLFIFIIIFLIFGAFMTYFSMMDNIQKAGNMVETVGKTRAQAIDVPLKEQFGYIEVLHAPYSNEYDDYFTESDYPPHDQRSMEATPGYDQAVIPETFQAYKDSVVRADQVAIETGLASLESRVKGFGTETTFLDADAGDFCIKVFPLPPGQKETIELSCTTPNGRTITSTEVINGVTHPLNNNETTLGIEYKDLTVYNAVFVAFAYEDKNSLLFRYFGDRFGIEPPVRRVARVVYPQIDTNTFGSGW